MSSKTGLEEFMRPRGREAKQRTSIGLSLASDAYKAIVEIATQERVSVAGACKLLIAKGLKAIDREVPASLTSNIRGPLG